MASMKDYETKCEVNRMVNKYIQLNDAYNHASNRMPFAFRYLWIWVLVFSPFAFGAGALLGLFIRLLSINRLSTSTWWITGVVCSIIAVIVLFIVSICFNKYINLSEQYKKELNELLTNMPEEYKELFKEALRENAAAKARVAQVRAEIRAITDKMYNDKQASYNNYMKKRNAEIELNKAINELDDEINKLQ